MSEQDKSLSERIEEGVKAAIAEELERHRRLGQSIVVWKDGKIVTLQPEEIGGNGNTKQKN